MKIDFCKIKKITAIEISVLIIVFIAIGIYYSPRLWRNQDVMMAAKIKVENEIFISKALEEFSVDKKAKPSIVAQKISDELNKTQKNPYNKKENAYTYETNCKGCNSVEFDDKQSMIILTSYNKRGELIARTVISPPSYVSYFKEKN